MNKQDESRLRSNKFSLQRRLQFEDGVLLAYLLQEKVFSEGTMQDIESKPTRSGKASALLSTLPRCGPSAFKVFVEALVESGQNDLVELLGPPQTLAPGNEHSPAKTPTEVSSEPKENVASGESNKEQASASKMEETTEQPVNSV
ncbi:hypothetical protein LSAT2_004762 [Lamellibrachia satsuma]|nr:hypothetical protein LSAT2_004762 [Lamellibrachia satsuma]